MVEIPRQPSDDVDRGDNELALWRSGDEGNVINHRVTIHRFQIHFNKVAMVLLKREEGMNGLAVQMGLVTVTVVPTACFHCFPDYNAKTS